MNECIPDSQMNHLSQRDLSEGARKSSHFLCHLGRNQLPVAITNIKIVPTDLALTKCPGIFYT